MASPATHMENSSFGVACIKNYGKDRRIRGLWIKKNYLCQSDMILKNVIKKKKKAVILTADTKLFP